MKKYLLSAFLLLSVSLSFAQSEKFTKAMEPLVAGLDTSLTREQLAPLANAFERIADAEKTQWLAFYYAALAHVKNGYSFTMDGGFTDKSADIDPLADKAEKLLNKAEELSKDNSEIWIVRKMLASLRLLGNPMARFQEYGPIAAAALETAKKLNPENPRVYLLEGQDLFFTPEQFGGDKAEAKKRFETAMAKFQVFKPGSSITPNWGLRDLNYFMTQIK